MYISLYLGINHLSFHLCVNGRWYTLFRNLETGKLQTAIWDNIFRKTGKKLPGLVKKHPFIQTYSSGHTSLYLNFATKSAYEPHP